MLDDSASEAPPPPGGAPPGAPAPPSATPSWRGVAIRDARLHAPAGARLLGGRPIAVAFEVGNPAGIWGRASATLAPAGGLPEIGVSVAWDDPAGSSLGDALPTLVEAVAQVPVAGASGTVPGGGLATVEGPPTVTLRTRYARDPRAASPSMSGSIAVEGGGPEGLAVVRGAGSPAGRTVVAGAAFATALMADASPAASPSGATGGTSAAVLLGVAGALGGVLGDGSTLVINRVEAEASSADPRAPLQFSLDYSAAVAIDPIDLELLRITLDPNVPLRARARNVRVEYDPTASGLERIHLNYADAEFAVEDPGRWTVEGPGDLFDVVGTRSGSGSTWFEIDLRFALDLGPVKVSGATIRATFDGGAPIVELRGLDAQIALPKLIEGAGLTDLSDDGVDIALAATLVPLQIGAMAFASYETVDGVRKVLLGVERGSARSDPRRQHRPRHLRVPRLLRRERRAGAARGQRSRRPAVALAALEARRVQAVRRGRDVRHRCRRGHRPGSRVRVQHQGRPRRDGARCRRAGEPAGQGHDVTPEVRGHRSGRG